MVALKARQTRAFCGAWRWCGGCCALCVGCRIGGDLQRVGAEGAPWVFCRGGRFGGITPPFRVQKFFRGLTDVRHCGIMGGKGEV